MARARRRPQIAPAFAALPPSMAVGRRIAPAFAALPPSMAVGRRIAPAFAALPPSMAVALLAVVLGSQASAHHSWARYDGDNVIAITGNITSIEWASPHVVVHFTVPADGA